MNDRLAKGHQHSCLQETDDELKHIIRPKSWPESLVAQRERHRRGRNRFLLTVMFVFQELTDRSVMPMATIPCLGGCYLCHDHDYFIARQKQQNEKPRCSLSGLPPPLMVVITWEVSPRWAFAVLLSPPPWRGLLRALPARLSVLSRWRGALLLSLRLAARVRRGCAAPVSQACATWAGAVVTSHLP